MDLHRGSQIMYLYTLFQSALNLFRIYGHLLATSAVNHCHFFTTESSGGPCRINGNITAAYNHNPVPGFSAIPEIDIPENPPVSEEPPEPAKAEPSENGKNGKKVMSPQKFVLYVADNLGFKGPEHVRATMSLLGFKSVPQDLDKRKLMYKGLEASRHLRDEKELTQDNALAALQEETTEPDA